MRSIRKELLYNNLILILCAGMFIAYGMIYHIASFLQDNRLMEEYQQIHELVLLNNQRKLNFKLYCKSHEGELLQVYYNDCDELNEQLDELSGKVQKDNNCKTQMRFCSCRIWYTEHKEEYRI